MASILLVCSQDVYQFWLQFFHFFTRPGREAGISLASLGPTMISQPGSASSSSPLIRATLPGITSFLCFTLSSIPVFLINGPIESPENLPAAQPVRTPSPSVSLTHSQDGILLPSISEATIK